MGERPSLIHNPDLHERANNILRALPPGLPFDLCQRIYLRSLRRSSQVTNKSASHLAYVMALREELKTGIAENQRASSSSASGIDRLSKQLECLKMKADAPGLGPDSGSDVSWRVFAPSSPGARRAWLVKQERRYAPFEDGQQTQSKNQIIEKSPRAVVSRKRGFHSSLTKIPVAKRGPRYLKHTVALYMDGETDSELSADEDDDFEEHGLESSNDSEGDGDDKSHEDRLEIFLRNHSASLVPGSIERRGNELASIPPLFVGGDIGKPVIKSDESGSHDKNLKGVFAEKRNSNRAESRVSISGASNTTHKIDPDANTSLEEPEPAISCKAKDRRRPSPSYGIDTTKETSKRLPKSHAPASKCPPHPAAGWEPYTSPDPNPFQKRAKPIAVLPSCRRPEGKEAPTVRGPTGFPPSKGQRRFAQTVHIDQTKADNSFLEAYTITPADKIPATNASRPLIPERTSSDQRHSAQPDVLGTSAAAHLTHLIPPEIQELMFRVERDAASLHLLPPGPQLSTHGSIPDSALASLPRTKSLDKLWRECEKRLGEVSTRATASERARIGEEKWKDVERLQRESGKLQEQVEREVDERMRASERRRCERNQAGGSLIGFSDVPGCGEQRQVHFDLSSELNSSTEEIVGVKSRRVRFFDEEKNGFVMSGGASGDKGQQGTTVNPHMKTVIGPVSSGKDPSATGKKSKAPVYTSGKAKVQRECCSRKDGSPDSRRV